MYNLMLKTDDNLPVSTPRVKNKQVADSLYNIACSDLFKAIIITGEVKIGYVRQYFGSKLVKEYHAEQQVNPNQPEPEQNTKQDNKELGSMGAFVS